MTGDIFAGTGRYAPAGADTVVSNDIRCGNVSNCQIIGDMSGAAAAFDATAAKRLAQSAHGGCNGH